MIVDALVAIMIFIIVMALVACNGNVDISINAKKIEPYFRAKCEQELPEAPPETIEACTNVAVANFLESLK